MRGPRSGLGAHYDAGAIANAASEGSEHLCQHVSGAYHMADLVAERGAPLFPPSVAVGGVCGPAEFFLQRDSDMFQFEDGVSTVPAEDAQGGKVA